MAKYEFESFEEGFLREMKRISAVNGSDVAIFIRQVGEPTGELETKVYDNQAFQLKKTSFKFYLTATRTRIEQLLEDHYFVEEYVCGDFITNKEQYNALLETFNTRIDTVFKLLQRDAPGTRIYRGRVL